ncbi:MAG: hypothetical protein ACM3UR_08975 [Bacteroidota bacterium]
MAKFIEKNLIYPETARQAGIEGWERMMHWKAKEAIKYFPDQKRQ